MRNIPQTTSANNVLAKDTNGELRWSLLTDLGISGGGTGYWTANGSNIYNSNAGNVGIGTTNPSDKLTLSGGNLLVNNGGIIAKDSVASN